MPLVGEWAYHRRGKSLIKPSTACGRPPFRRGTQPHKHLSDRVQRL
nr:MAG TPA: hypothetical protein [Caudoviricetes sp.]